MTKFQTILLTSILLGVVFTTLDIQNASGLDLGLGPGEIHGQKWNDLNGDGINDPGEPGLLGVEICLADELIFINGVEEGTPVVGFDPFLPPALASSPELACDFTDADGNYWFIGLEFKEYFVFEKLPSGTTNTTPIFQTVDLLVVGPIVNDIDFGNKVANAPPPEVTIEGASSFEHEGLPVVHFTSETTYIKDVTAHCVAGSPVAVKLVIGPFAETPTEPPVEMMMTNTGGEIWEATFGPFIPAHGTAPLTFYVDCPPDTTGFPEDISLISGEDEIQDGGNIYIDPSGRILDSCTGLPLEGAIVTLLKDDIFFPGTFPPAPASTPPIIPAVNPQTTLADGLYGWVVIPGDYKVEVDKAGFILQTSGVLTIPPAVTDLDFTLERVDGCPPEPALIDIKPSVNCKANKKGNINGVVPIGISGDSFDVSTIDLNSLTLNNNPTSEVHDKLHIKGKGSGAVIHVPRADICAATSVQKGLEDVTLRGSNADGEFEGTDTVRIVKR